MLTGAIGLPGAPAFAQSWLTFASGSDLYTLPISGGERLFLENETAVDSTEYQALNWSPSGEFLAVVQNYDTVILLEPDQSTATPLFKSTCDRPPTLALHWSPTGSRLMINESCETPLRSPAVSRAVYVYETTTGALAQPLATLPTAIDSDAYPSPDGEFVAYVKDQHIYRLSVNGGSPQQMTANPGEYGRAGSPLAWSPDGQQLAFYEGTYPYQQLKVIGLDGSGAAAALEGQRRVLTAADQQIYRSRVFWSPDSRSIAFYVPNNAPYSNQETIQLVEVATGQTTTVTAPGFYDAIAWSPDSQRLIFASGDRFTAQYLYLWDRVSQAFTQLNQTPLTQVDSLLWTATGDQLVLTAVPPGDELGNRQLYGLTLNGQELQSLSRSEDYVFPVTLGSQSARQLSQDPDTANVGR